MNFSRENTVALIAGVMLVLTGWAWGGVVLWTQFVTCGLGALALIVALTPRDRTSTFMPAVRQGTATALALGLFVAIAVILLDWTNLLEQRASTLELIPDAVLPRIDYINLCLPGFGVGVATATAAMFVSVLRTPTHARLVLLSFPPFWIGVALFSFIAIQSLNSWGLVVERDLTWKIIPQDHIRWLPAGLSAPFVGDDDPGGMNGWRQMLILSGPWMLLCALHAAVTRSRTYAKLAWIVGINSLAVGVVGAVVAAGKNFSFLGFANWFAHKAPFGPFIYRNHAGVYLYLSAALILALVAYLIAKKGERADRGGPHLVASVLFVMLALCSFATMSIGAALGAALLLAVAPALYFLDRRIRSALSPAPALMLVGAGLLLGYVALDSFPLKSYMQRIEKKQAYVEQTGFDDRAPLRRAAYAQIEDGGDSRLAFGWGAGSFRWTSPPYFAQQPEFVDAKGRLWARANFTHCDWLQALLEWGIVGCTLLLGGGIWLGLKIIGALRRRSALMLALSAAILVTLAHALLDFIFYFTPVLTLFALIVAWLVSREDGDAPDDGYGVRPPTR